MFCSRKNIRVVPARCFSSHLLRGSFDVQKFGFPPTPSKNARTLEQTLKTRMNPSFSCSASPLLFRLFWNRLSEQGNPASFKQTVDDRTASFRTTENDRTLFSGSWIAELLYSGLAPARTRARTKNWFRMDNKKPTRLATRRLELLHIILFPECRTSSR